MQEQVFRVINNLEFLTREAHAARRVILLRKELGKRQTDLLQNNYTR